jgi:hypothetical protein
MTANYTAVELLSLFDSGLHALCAVRLIVEEIVIVCRFGNVVSGRDREVAVCAFPV